MRAKQWTRQQQQQQREADDDWILLNESDFELEEEEEVRAEGAPPKANSELSDCRRSEKASSNLREAAAGTSFLLFTSAKEKQREEEERRKRQMALDANDIELIRASWIPARKDPTGSGVLLFKGLFTKFPDYLNFFSQFKDLDIESLQENRRLIKHAVKVIDTVTFVVDSIGDQTKADQLNEALINLVRSHLKRRIGLTEFRNLGIVIIDFICDLQQRRGSPPRARTSSPCENASLESMVSSEADDSGVCTRCQNYNHNHSNHASLANHYQQAQHFGTDELFSANMNDLTSTDLHHHNHPLDHDHHEQQRQSALSSLDTGLLVAAWTKLYSSILDLVKRESGGDEDGGGQ